MSAACACRYYVGVGVRCVCAVCVVAVVVPLLVGLLMELLIVVPLRVPMHQTPIVFLWQDWALGVLYTKVRQGDDVIL